MSTVNFLRKVRTTYGSEMLKLFSFPTLDSKRIHDTKIHVESSKFWFIHFVQSILIAMLFYECDEAK